MDYRPFIEKTLSHASQIALSYFGSVSSSVKPDDNNQVLTEADIKIGEYLVNEITTSFPKYNIIDEEASTDRIE